MVKLWTRPVLFTLEFSWPCCKVTKKLRIFPHYAMNWGHFVDTITHLAVWHWPLIMSSTWHFFYVLKGHKKVLSTLYNGRSTKRRGIWLRRRYLVCICSHKMKSNYVVSWFLCGYCLKRRWAKKEQGTMSQINDKRCLEWVQTQWFEVQPRYLWTTAPAVFVHE